MKEWIISCLPVPFCHIFQKVNCGYGIAISDSSEMPATDKKVKRSNASSQESPALANEFHSLFA